jgi:4-nitrophenyl phosphatase
MMMSVTTNNSVRRIRAMIIDMDGVLWRSTEPIGDLPAIFNAIHGKGIDALLATNNPTLSVEQYLAKLKGFGVSLDPDRIITSAIATAQYLKERFPQGGSVYVIGEAGIKQALTDIGFDLAEVDALAVVVSLDRELTYDKLLHATLLIRAGTPFIVTNQDNTLPIPGGFAPGAGSISAALITATEKEPIVIGKPQPEMYKLALERMNVSPQETLVVGDRLETDIAGGQSLGCVTGVVLSGVATAESARKWHSIPDYIEPDLSSLVAKL